MFPLKCRRRDRVGRSENLFIFHLFFSLLKMGVKDKNAIKSIISTRIRHAMKVKTIKKLAKVSLNIIVASIVVLKS